MLFPVSLLFVKLVNGQWAVSNLPGPCLLGLPLLTRQGVNWAQARQRDDIYLSRHITENEIKATIWKELDLCSLSYRVVRPEAFTKVEFHSNPIYF